MPVDISVLEMRADGLSDSSQRAYSGELHACKVSSALYAVQQCWRSCLDGTAIPARVNGYKGKFDFRTGREGPQGELRYSSTVSLSSALDAGGWLTPRPGRFTSGKETRYPFCRRLSGSQGLSGQCGKCRPLPGFDPRTVQRVVSRYTD